ncbi:MAG TPA: hypothetical protein VIG64_15320 [Actinomycetota bacterium]
MAALAYLFLPVSGLFAYLTGTTPRARLHGLQAVVLGLTWPVALYACTYVSAGATQACWIGGALVWLAFMVAAALGADPRIPFLGKGLARVARADPRSPA